MRIVGKTNQSILSVSSIPHPSSEGLENINSVRRWVLVFLVGQDVKHVCKCIREQHRIFGIFEVPLLLRGVGGSVEIWDVGEPRQAIPEVRHGKGIRLDLELPMFLPC
jgi:hypothetical protein